MLTEFCQSEQVTAAITSHMDSGENYEGAICVGYYRDPDCRNEVWIEFNGTRQNIQLADVDVLCKQLKRAVRLAKEA